MILPVKGNKLILAHLDHKANKVDISDFGVKITQPAFIFSESEKKGIAVMDSNDFQEIMIKFENDKIDKIINIIPIKDLLPKNSGPFIPYYNMKTMLLYIMFPKIGKYLILRHKKKKLANHISGNISTFNDIGGIVGLFKPEIGDIIFFHDHSGIYLLHAKIILPKNEKVNNAPMSLPNENKEEKKEKKNKGKFNQQLDKPHSPKEAKPIQAQEEVKENIRDVIKKEIDNAIKTTVLPVIEHHMSQFENEFHTLISNEIATLRKTVEEESTKMQSTGKVFEMFMERMLDIYSHISSIF